MNDHHQRAATGDEDSGRAVPRPRGWWMAIAGVIGALVALTAVGVVGAATFSLASQPECDPVNREELTLAEMGELHRTLRAYQSDPTGPMALSARQCSFLLREEFGLQAWFTLADDQMEAEVRLPGDGRCWNLHFEGDVEIVDRLAFVRPTTLSVGDLSLTWLLAGRTVEVGPDSLGQERARELLSHLLSVELQGETVLVRVDDPKWLR